jgi:hypothetical protein
MASGGAESLSRFPQRYALLAPTGRRLTCRCSCQSRRRDIGVPSDGRLGGGLAAERQGVRQTAVGWCFAGMRMGCTMSSIMLGGAA